MAGKVYDGGFAPKRPITKYATNDAARAAAVGIDESFVGPLGMVRTAYDTVVDLPAHADDAAAKTAGLTQGELYRTATGAVMVVLA